MDGDRYPLSMLEGSFVLPRCAFTFIFVAGLVTWVCRVPSASAQNAVRATGGLQVLYDFRGDGPIVKDRSGVGSPLDLRIDNIKGVRRSSGSIEVTAGVRISSGRPAKKIIDAVKRSGELTVEAWVRPAKNNQSGPARIVTLSKDTGQRNFTLGQDNANFDIRFRTQSTDSNGLPSLATPENSAGRKLAHVVYTRNRDGQSDVYLDGQRVGRREVKGALSNWANDFPLALANELSGDRPWFGTYHLVAVYSRALGGGEVKNNFRAGHGASQTPEPVESQPLASGGRAAEGLQVLYDFRESEGNVVKDRAGVGKPLDLQIKKVDHVRRTEGALRITGENVIRSSQPAKRLIDAVKRSGSLTVEAWVRPLGLKQRGPARIVTLSKNANERNFTLGQEGDHVEFRLRTTKTSTNGIPSVNTAGKTLREKLTQIVYTRDRKGTARLYLDGRQSTQTKVNGAMNNWDDSFQLALADELSGDRTWRGEIHLVAVYSRDLSPREVEQNFRAGPKGRNTLLLASNGARANMFETEIAPILSQHCLECHDSASKKGGLDLSRKAAAFAGGESGEAIVAGKSSQSLLWESVAGDVMPQDRPPLSDEQKRRLGQWIDSGAQWTIDYVDPAIYRNVRTGENWVQRLTIPQYIATVRAAVGVDISKEAWKLLPQDKRADGFRNTAYNLTVDLGHVEAYAKLAQAIVAKMDTVAYARKFSKSRQLTDDNMRALIADMGKIILRGPLDEREVVVYRGISTTVASAGGDFREAVALVLEAMLQSPRFIYRIENQVGDGSQWPVGNYELASRMSYILWGGPPDNELFKAADSGDLGDPQQLRRHIARMLEDPRAVEQSKQFVIEWLNLDRLDNMKPNALKFPHWDAQLARDMREETIEFFLDVVWKQNRPLSDLLNAQFTYSTPRLAKHYGIKAQGEKFVRYDLAEIPSRGGLLTHGSVLTIGGDDASMVTRGLFVLNDLLFSEVGDPPPGLDTTPVPTSPGRTHRAIATERVESTACGGCHSRFEPLAFGLEKFDGLGTFHEVDEHGNQLREDGEILFPGEAKPVEYKSTAQLMDLLAGSDRVSQCLTRKVTQFALGRPLFASDAPSLRAIHEASQKAGGTYRSLITEIIMSDLVQRTHTEAAEND